ncbi:VOC family protein [Devosia sp. 2618]|uniref:VOC family protein n=1 Tax=Devosia sp. 2618 TaxID=3156454 RepID=UPI00339A7B92
MFSHITVGASDLDRAASFYDAVLLPLGLRRRVVAPDGGPPAVCWVGGGHRSRAFMSIHPTTDSLPAPGMAAFLAASAQAVDAAHAAGLANGGTDDGAPGIRVHYGPDYYGAYLRDPDGNKLHLVFRGERLI